MDFDDLVIGSGLAALGTVSGLLTHKARKVVVLCGPLDNQFAYYDARRNTPCAFLGPGGLGNYWHGVIPTGWKHNFGAATDDGFAALFKRFYPHAQIRSRLGSPALFVPWRAIRPAQELQKLAAAHAGQLQLVMEPAVKLELQGSGAAVTALSRSWFGKRVWVAAGALHSPALLARTFGPEVQRGLVNDHVFCYVGQVDHESKPRVSHTRDGVFFPAIYNDQNASVSPPALYSLRPAAFDFRRLDHGIELRAVFGLPTGTALSKISRRMSPGLLVEAFYNRFGLFGNTAIHSVYAQVAVADAYEFVPGQPDAPLQARTDKIRAATDAARIHQPYPNLRHSRQPGIHIPGIHLHHTVDLQALASCGVNTAGSPIQVVDASVLNNIGPDHHSFKMMLAAHDRARSSGPG